MRKTINVPIDGWWNDPRDFDGNARSILWEEATESIGAISITTTVHLALFAQGYRIMVCQSVKANSAIAVMACHIVNAHADIGVVDVVVPQGRNIVVEELPMGSYQINDPHGLLCGPELSSEELYAIIEAHRPQ